MFESFFGRVKSPTAKPRSSVERVVGDIKEKQKAVILRMIAECFDDQVFKELQGKEREKTANELKIIQLANDATNELRRHFGLPNFDIPPKNIHVVRKENWPIRQGAVYSSHLQSVVVREPDAKMIFAATTVHEILHFKSYNALQATIRTKRLEVYRIGLSIFERNGDKVRFNNLNEAVTEELTKRMMTHVFRDRLFADEREQTVAMLENEPNLPATSGGNLFDDDTYYVAAKQGAEGKRIVNAYGFGYQRERTVLSSLVDKICSRYPDRYKNKDAVLEIFACGMMTGKLMEIGRLVEGAFGKGTLRSIAEMDDNVERQLSYVEHL